MPTLSLSPSALNVRTPKLAIMSIHHQLTWLVCVASHITYKCCSAKPRRNTGYQKQHHVVALSQMTVSTYSNDICWCFFSNLDSWIQTIPYALVYLLPLPLPLPRPLPLPPAPTHKYQIHAMIVWPYTCHIAPSDRLSTTHVIDTSSDGHICGMSQLQANE